MKHFPFDPGERENRDVNNGDDCNAEEHRTADLFTRGEHGVEAFFSCQWAAKMVLTNPELTHDISTMTTAPSMIRPKSIAPRLIKFPETPNFNMPVTANRNESGMAAVTMSAARQLPSNTSKTAMTKIAPSNKLFRTV